MRRLRLLFSVVTVLLAARASLAQTTRPVPQIKHAVIISIDGLRPDLLLRANTPNLHRLFNSGCFSFWARTTELSVTLPSHTSMLTGVTPEKHGITFNDDGPEEQVYPRVPTLFQLAKKAGYTTAVSTTKSKFTALTKDVDWVSVPPRKQTFSDEDAARHALDMLREHRPDVLFLHLGNVDAVGHAIGWATPEQIAAIEVADACVGQVLAALKELGLADSTFVLVTADHGGTGRWHGPDDPRARHIPWIIAGPGLRRGLDLTTYRELTINTEDTFATACWLLNIPIEETIDGKAVRLITETPPAQLIYEVPGATNGNSGTPQSPGK
jgi:predicted AlkP superfamily pyrophosphatase or phosphodiesterase